jgi:rhamnose transport system permease protein
VSFFNRYRWWHETILFLMLVLLLLVAAQVMPNFVSVRGQWILSKHVWETALLALGMTLIVITGGIDLSVGSAMGMCAITFGMMYEQTGNLAISCCACLLVGGLGGGLNGWLIAKLKVHPLIVTLATYAAFRGIAEGVSQGRSYSQFGEAFSNLARGTLWSAPIPAFLFAGLAMVYAIALARTPFGRQLYAIGHSEQASTFSGIRVASIKFWLYTGSGLLAGLATLIYVSRFDTAKADAGTGIELEVITAVVIGGTSIFGGRGNILGTVLGLALIHETNLFVGRYWQIDELKSIILGVTLIVSVLVYQLFSPSKHE